MSHKSLVGVLWLSLGLAACGGGDGDGGADAAATDGAATSDAAATETGVVTGTIRTAGGGEAEPLPGVGVTVAVLGGAATTTTDAAGFYSLEAPTGLTRLVASKAEHWGTIYTLTHTTADATDVNFEIIPNQLVADVSAQLEGAPIDPTDGVVFFEFETDYAGGGETADVTTSEGVLTFDAKDAVVEEPSLQAGGGSFLLFHGVPVGTTTPTVTGASGVNTCVLDPAEATTYPVQAATFTFVRATCTPL